MRKLDKFDKVGKVFLWGWVAMCLGILIMALTTNKCQGQVSFISTLGVSTSNKYIVVSAELQASNVSVIGEWRPVQLERYVYIDGYGLQARYYLYPYQSSPFLSMGVITHGKMELEKMTGMAVRSMPIVIGFRFYPSQYNDNILDRLSFDILAGVELLNNGIKPYVELSGNFILFKAEK
jgi:hypothetical protein